MIKILKNPLTENYINLKNKVLGVDFPWYYYATVTRSNYTNGENFPFYMHTTLIKPQEQESETIPAKINSEYYDRCVTVLEEIFDFNQIKVKTLYRVRI